MTGFVGCLALFGLLIVSSTIDQGISCFNLPWWPVDLDDIVQIFDLAMHRLVRAFAFGLQF